MSEDPHRDEPVDAPEHAEELPQEEDQQGVPQKVDELQ